MPFKTLFLFAKSLDILVKIFLTGNIVSGGLDSIFIYLFMYSFGISDGSNNSVSREKVASHIYFPIVILGSKFLKSLKKYFICLLVALY